MRVFQSDILYIDSHVKDDRCLMKQSLTILYHFHAVKISAVYVCHIYVNIVHFVHGTIYTDTYPGRLYLAPGVSHHEMLHPQRSYGHLPPGGRK